VGELRAVLAAMPPAKVEPETIWGWSASLPYDIHICWSGSDGCFDVVFRRKGVGRLHLPPGCAGLSPARKPWHLYANNPLLSLQAGQLTQHLRAFLHQRLPEYQVPSAFVVLDALPRLPAGRVDTAALPAPDQDAARTAGEAFVAPRDSLEATVAQLWGEIFGLQQVSAEANAVAHAV
jgi:hypothetical protein